MGLQATCVSRPPAILELDTVRRLEPDSQITTASSTSAVVPYNEGTSASATQELKQEDQKKALITISISISIYGSPQDFVTSVRDLVILHVPYA